MWLLRHVTHLLGGTDAAQFILCIYFGKQYPSLSSSVLSSSCAHTSQQSFFHSTEICLDKLQFRDCFLRHEMMVMILILRTGP